MNHIRPSGPVRIHCTACNWNKFFSSRSDCLVLGLNSFESCPECGSKDISTTELPIPSGMAQTAEILINSISKLFK